MTHPDGARPKERGPVLLTPCEDCGSPLNRTGWVGGTRPKFCLRCVDDRRKERKKRERLALLAKGDCTRREMGRVSAMRRLAVPTFKPGLPCPVCYDLPHRRPSFGCSCCKEPFAREVIERTWL